MPTEGVQSPPSAARSNRATLVVTKSGYQWGIALASVGVVTGFKWLCGPLLWQVAPFRLFLLAVLVSGWLAGWRSAALALLLSTLIGRFLFAMSAPATVTLVSFVIEGGALSAILGVMHRARGKLADSDAQKTLLLLAHDQSAARLKALSELTAALSVALNHADVARVIVDHGALTLRADTCTLYRRDKQGTALHLIGERGVARAVLDRINHISPESNAPTWRALTTGETVWVETEREYVDFYPELAQLPAAGPRAKAFFCAPLLVENEPFGLLGMGFYEERAFPEEEREFIDTFARHCAQALLRAERLTLEREARKQAEQARSLLNTTLRSIGDGVVATDCDGRVTFMNAVAVQLTGWDEREAVNRRIEDVFNIVNEETRAPVENPVLRVRREGGVVGLANHTVLLAKHGSEIPIDDSAAPIRDESGQTHGAVLVFRDVSEKKRVERQRAFLAEVTSTLTSSLDYHETLTGLARLVVPRLADWCAIEVLEAGRGPVQVAVAHVDPEKVAFARELGREYPADPRAEVGVPQVIRTRKAEFYPHIPEELLRAQAKDVRHLSLIEQLRLRSAMVIPLLARDQVLGAITFVYAESGRGYTTQDLQYAQEIAHRASIAIDNARLYEAEQRARQSADVANRAKDEFLATVSHELRTPLNAILGWAKLLVGTELDEPKRLRAAETIERNAVAMARLVEDLIDISRIVSGKIRIESRPVDFAAVVRAALESARPSIDAKGIQLTCQISAGSPSLTGDAGRLQQVVWNLLSNAVKFTERGGRVELRLEQKDAQLELEVRDTGRGITAQFLPYVFERFRQFDGSITRSFGGLGLGLSIARDIILLHGGEIRAESPGEGRGATFVVSLPVSDRALGLEDARGSSDGREGTFERPAILRGLRVLVVDDDEDSRHLVSRILEECGSQVLIASTVRDALSLIDQSPIDVLVSDIAMPGEDGFELIRQLRAMPGAIAGQLPAIALTAYTRAEERRQLLLAGYASHVPKPVEPAELVSVVAHAARARG